MTEAEKADILAAKARGCERCQRAISEDEPVSVGGGVHDNRLVTVVRCEQCTEAIRAERQAYEAEQQRRRAEEDTRRRRKVLKQSFADSQTGAGAACSKLDMNHLRDWTDVGQDDDGEIFSHGPLQFPEFEWARFSNPEFVRRASPTILQAVKVWDPGKGESIVVVGKTGVAKSSSLVAWTWNEYGKLHARVEAGEKLTFRFAWVTGYELSGARKRSKIGDEAPIVRIAMETPLLFLDEVGHEPVSEEIMTVIDARYRAQLPTALTSPLEWKALANHIGGGAYRRLLEHGKLVDVHAEKARVRAV